MTDTIAVTLRDRLLHEHETHQTVYDDDRRRKALFKEAADALTEGVGVMPRPSIPIMTHAAADEITRLRKMVAGLITSDVAKTLEAVRLLRYNAYSLYRETLRENLSPVSSRLRSRIINPRPGDLVIETSTMYTDGSKFFEGIGRLKCVRFEPVFSVAELKEQDYPEGCEIPREKVYYIYLVFDDGRLFRWSNANFIAVLDKAWKW